MLLSVTIYKLTETGLFVGKSFFLHINSQFIKFLNGIGAF